MNVGIRKRGDILWKLRFSVTIPVLTRRTCRMCRSWPLTYISGAGSTCSGLGQTHAEHMSRPLLPHSIDCICLSVCQNISHVISHLHYTSTGLSRFAPVPHLIKGSDILHRQISDVKARVFKQNSQA